MKNEDVILGLLKEREYTGYEIVERIKTIFSHFFEGSYGSVYPVLHKLEKDGKVTKQTVVQDGRPNKYVYSITAAGVAHFQNYLDSDVRPEAVRSDFLVRLYFGAQFSSERLRELIEEEIVRKQALLNHLEHIKQKWGAEMDTAERLCLDIGFADYRARLAVLRGALEQEQME
ncbi:MAG: helix-turn-helix transcriptional regulator [Sporolactobacillus sp.]